MINLDNSQVNFDNEELDRYSRQIILSEIGLEGQKKLKNASILCIGAGGLGSPILTYLAACGIGKIGIVEFDTVSLSNLHRQVLYTTNDIGKKKSIIAKKRVQRINPRIEVVVYDEYLSTSNAINISSKYDVIIDGSDNFKTRYLSNDLAVITKKPNIYGSIFKFEGQVSVFNSQVKSPCYRCLFPSPPKKNQIPSCQEAGVLGILPSIIGSIQVNEAIKVILGIGEPLIGELLHFNSLNMRFNKIKLKKDPTCPVCSNNPSITSLREIDLNESCKNTGRLNSNIIQIEVTELKNRIDSGAEIEIIDVRTAQEIEIADIHLSTTKIPMNEIHVKINEIPKNKPIAILCKSGIRSQHVAEYLENNGFKEIYNISGGINAWSKQIDNSIPLY